MCYNSLHNHTEYSMLDGMAKINDLVAKAKIQNMDAIGLTDHGNLYGAMPFYRAARAAGIKPVLGIETYIVAHGKSASEKVKGDKSFHLLLLAQNNTGWKNIMALSTEAQLNGFYYYPRIDHILLEKYSEGVIATTGCMASEFHRADQDGRYDEFESLLVWYKRVFKDRFYVEMQEHGIPELTATNTRLLDAAKRHSLPLLASNDVHYTEASDVKPHDALLCMQTGSKVSDEKRMRFSSATNWMKGRADIVGLPDEAFDNTKRLSDSCSVEIKNDGYHVPVFAGTAKQTQEGYLRSLCEDGVKKYYKPEDHQAATDRLNYELEIISKMGFASYFLVVWDIINFCYDKGIWHNVRGSAAGSIVAYALGLTYVEPMSNGLYFERFLNPSRVSMPDIDMDFEDTRRGEVVDYTVAKYGPEYVSQIITFNAMGAKQTVKDVSRVMGIPLADAIQLSKAVGDAAELSQVPEALEMFEIKSHEHFEAVAHMKRLEGTVRGAGTHAAGVIIADKPVREYVPLNRTLGDGLSKDIQSLTQWDMNELEAMGLLKMDFLGLSTLTLMRRVCELVKKNHDKDLNIRNIPINDTASIKAIFWKGLTEGVFQSSGEGITNVFTQLKPSGYDDVCAVIALYRPGPIDYIPTYIKRKHGEEKVKFDHPALKEIFGATYGVCVYQESLQKMFQVVAGYSLGDADLVRKAVGKKDKEALKKHEQKFKTGGAVNGYPKALLDKLWSDVEPFARYSFNKAHSAAYGRLSCQTAYLKYHYPREFFAVLFDIESGDKEKLSALQREAKVFGIKLLPPSINSGTPNFHIEGKHIRFGINGIKGVSQKTAQEHADKGPYNNIEDFMFKTGAKKPAVEAYIKAGAFDAMGNRAHMLPDLLEGRMSGAAKQEAAARAAGQTMLWETDKTTAPEFKRIKLTKKEIEDEREMTGIYFTENPNKPVGLSITHSIDTMPEIGKVAIGGVIRKVKTHTTKKGDPMAFVSIEDDTGQCDLVVFPKSYEEFKDLLVIGNMVNVAGKIEQEGKIIVDVVSDLPLKLEKLGFKVKTDQGFYLVIPATYPPKKAAEFMEVVVEVAKSYRGNVPFFVKHRDTIISYDFEINPIRAFLQDIIDLHGYKRNIPT